MNKTQDILIIIGLGVLLLGYSRPAHAMQNSDQQPVPAKGFTLVNAAKYAIQVPTGWTVGTESPWGARDISPKTGPGKMGAMTAGPTKDSWDSLYKTSLFFIKREQAGSETQFRTGKTKQGYECISFEVKNRDGFASRRYTILKDPKGNALALSIKIPTPGQEKAFVAMFQHMVDTAMLKG